MNHDESELPEWVKLVNRILHRQRKWEEEKRRFDRGLEA
jgi:ABC-type amino acid transport substrate-binding protein